MKKNEWREIAKKLKILTKENFGDCQEKDFEANCLSCYTQNAVDKIQLISDLVDDMQR